jgi:hypothetical protein
MTNLYGPAVWCEGGHASVETAGVWLRRLKSEGGGDGVVLFYLEPGGAHKSNSERPTNLLLLAGSVAIEDGPLSRLVHSCTYAPVGQESIRTTQDAPALGVLISGPALGNETRSFASPRYWVRLGPGLLSVPLCETQTEGELAERVVGFVHVESGGSVPSHPHATAHIFVYIDGEADDEIVFPDGHLETAQRRKGDFVVYPFPVEHRLFSPTGCSFFCFHEPLLYGRAS